jgi:hypothetical protein
MWFYLASTHLNNFWTESTNVHLNTMQTLKSSMYPCSTLSGIHIQTQCSGTQNITVSLLINETRIANILYALPKYAVILTDKGKEGRGSADTTPIPWTL